MICQSKMIMWLSTAEEFSCILKYMIADYWLMPTGPVCSADRLFDIRINKDIIIIIIIIILLLLLYQS